MLLHLVNYNARQTAGGVAVKVRVKTGTVQSVRFMSPDPAISQTIPFEVTPQGCSFVVPQWKVYAAILIDGIGV